MIGETQSEPDRDRSPREGDDPNRLPWSHIVVALKDDAERCSVLIPRLEVTGLDDPLLPGELPTGPGSCVLVVGTGAMRAAGSLRGFGVEQVFGCHLPPGCEFLCQLLEQRAAAVQYLGGPAHLREVLDAWASGARLLDVAPVEHPDLPRQLPTLEVLSLHNLGTMARRAEIVDSLILDDSLNALIAPPKNYKTVIGDALCIAVADGTSWLDRTVKKAGLVIDWALEGVAGKADRYRAQIGLSRFLDAADPVHRRLFLLREMPDITVSSGQDIVLRTIEKLLKETGEKLTLLKVDTLARGMSRCGRDENSTQDMGAFIAGLDRIRAQFPCAQLVVHHTGKSGLVERGSTALTGAADLVMFCKREGKLAAKVWIRDARDIEVPDPWDVTFAAAVVGAKDDGTHITALHIETVRTSSPSVVPSVGPGAESELAVMHALESASGRRLTREELCEITGFSASTIDATYRRLKVKDCIDRAKVGKPWVYFLTNCRATDGKVAGTSNARQLPPQQLVEPQLTGVTGPSLEGPHPSVAGRQLGPQTADDGIPDHSHKHRRKGKAGRE